MSNFIFSINAVLPVFLVMAVGYILRVKGKVTEEFCNVANDINFKVTLPALLFMDMSNTDIRKEFDTEFVLYCAIVTIICFTVIWLLAKIFIKDKSIIGAFVQGSFRGSAAVLGIAFIQNIYGNAGMAPMMIIGAVPLYNIFSVVVLTLEANDTENMNRKEHIKKACINICKNPIILSILAGVIVSLLRIDFPVVIDKTIENIAKLATPLALLIIGATFEGKKAIARIKPTVVGAAIKLFVQPAVFLPIAVAMGFTDEKLMTVLIMLGSPTTPSSYIMAKAMKNDETLTSSMIVTTTLFSAVSMTLWVFALRTIGVM